MHLQARSRSRVIDFNKFSGKAQVRRATLSCDSSYKTNINQVQEEPCKSGVVGLIPGFFNVSYETLNQGSISI